MAAESVIEIEVNSAARLPDTRTFGSQRPYCKLLLDGEEVAKTNSSDDASAPMWTRNPANHKLPSSDKDKTVTVEVWDKGRMSDSLIASVSMTVSEFMVKSKENPEIPLERKGKAAGVVHVVVQEIS